MTNSTLTNIWILSEINSDSWNSRNRAKFDWDAFRGNVIHLGKLSRYDFMKKMYPDAETRAKFKYPPGGLMQLQGVVTYEDLRRPTMLDANGEECLIVVKNGATTGFTFGRATGIESFVREYEDGAIHSTSREVAVYPYSNKEGVFSAPGDSGSVVVDANYGIVRILIGGAGRTDFTDVTYVSAYVSLEERIKQVFPNSYLFPTCNPTPA